eukprot:CAMPEP_0179176662 /NCGR_PEP_ID=MMETSP0796-20121207/87356_1 /TAXON_ID=73915 /ORGANISM="Pyrodinium bahamense, Strain pbaha01" /LENGTH=305 /DNA_ID=CAMNT_0020880201 /DNA_START=210 /DNA_END=1124 /DNA_ORIENTATION=+
MRAENPTWYGFQLDGQPMPKPDYNRPWFEERNGAFYCLLCGSWATEGHLSTPKHQWRQAWPQSYGFPGYKRTPEVQGPQATAPINLLPARWEKVWSSDYKAFYFAHTVTWITQWEEPAVAPCSGGATPPPMPPQASAAAGLAPEVPGDRQGAEGAAAAGDSLEQGDEWAPRRQMKLDVKAARRLVDRHLAAQALLRRHLAGPPPRAEEASAAPAEAHPAPAPGVESTPRAAAGAAAAQALLRRHLAGPPQRAEEASAAPAEAHPAPAPGVESTPRAAAGAAAAQALLRRHLAGPPQRAEEASAAP